MGKATTKTIKIKKSKSYTNEEKKRVAEEVEKYPELWKLSDPNHSKCDAIVSAWDKISDELTIPVDECKVIWKKIKDAFRYREKTRSAKPKPKKRKSGDSLNDSIFSDDEEEEPEELDDDDWFLSETCNFLKEKKLKRETISSSDGLVDVREDTSNDLADLTQGDKNKTDETPTSSKTISKSNYDYAIKNKRETKPDPETKQLIDGMSELIKLRKTQMEEPAKDIGLKYISMYTNLDRMLKKLPEEVVEDLNFKFVNLVYEELKKN